MFGGFCMKIYNYIILIYNWIHYPNQVEQSLEKQTDTKIIIQNLIPIS